jgi:hypothetical protein
MNYLLNNAQVQQWSRRNIHQNKIEEKKWGCDIISKDTVQYTTVLGERIVQEALTILNENPRRETINGLKPDWVCNNAIYEVKTRTWNTPGTAGEKVLGVPFKYAELASPERPLKIVCVAYQESELTKGKFPIFNEEKMSSKQKQHVEFWKSQNIHYVKFTVLLNEALEKLQNTNNQL